MTDLVAVRPSARQVAWQRMEFYGFLHFGMNTMTDREWGTGHEDPALFDPGSVDADQWVRALKSAGMTGVILTCKHHDGFALWPSDVSKHSVASSPYPGDVVGEVAAAARRHGLKFGVYLSPWDRTEASYGSGTAYDDFYVAQLTELLTRYGPIFSVWLDGANGEGPNGKTQWYDWERYYAVVRELQPGAVINVCGPDVRWCGNEAGDTRPDEWSVVPRELQDAERTAERSQQADDGEFARQTMRSDERDLGSRDALAGHTDLVWYPAEVNTSIRPGWFHHPAEDDAVRPVDELFDIYLKSVGGNACFLLNVPPARDGRIHDADVAALSELGRRIEDFRSRAVAGSFGTPWAATVELDPPRSVEAVVIGEDITQGQRVEHVVVTARRDGAWWPVAEANAVGYQRILTFEPLETDAVRIEVTAARATPVVDRVAVIAS
ncbi:alpha-L-fucosidase [Actinoplanes solisilvae]|uniref:alpha-L-fucosidase n=1 Tax=Actinoplanes solisilvae TaxID=2486853 RepID=UPI000FD6FC28|nr:alpha-L-fucosidase [Actinoplanes solisilvae]